MKLHFKQCFSQLYTNPQCRTTCNDATCLGLKPMSIVTESPLRNHTPLTFNKHVTEVNNISQLHIIQLGKFPKVCSSTVSSKITYIAFTSFDISSRDVTSQQDIVHAYATVKFKNTVSRDGCLTSLKN
jgi:hypothetical protein